MQQSYDPGPGISISTLAYEYPPAWQVSEHAHRSDQLIYAVSGVMEVSVGRALLLVPPLLRELILEAARLTALCSRNSELAAVRDTLVSQIGRASSIPTTLTMPQDTRARKLAHALLAQLGVNRKLEVECQDVGISVRTLQRLPPTKHVYGDLYAPVRSHAKGMDRSL